MPIKRIRHLSFLLFSFGFIITGCSPFGAGTQQSTRYYVLSSLQSEEIAVQPVDKLPDIGIGVGPIRMPLYLDRSDIVTRGSQNKVDIADFATWAGPLQENLSRVLAENLSVLLSTDKVAVFPWARSDTVDYNVTVYITRFDGMPGDQAYLRARWAILDRKRKDSFFENHTVVSRPTQDDTIESLVAAKSATVADLSREIARAMVEVSSKHPPGQK